MGNSVASPFSELSTRSITLPIPAVMSDPLVSWYRRENTDSHYVTEFQDFLNDPNKIKSVIIYGSLQYLETITWVMRVMSGTYQFKPFLDNGSLPMYGDRMEGMTEDDITFSGMGDRKSIGGLKVVKHTTGRKVFMTKGIHFKILMASMKNERQYREIVFISKESADGYSGHANMGLLTYSPPKGRMPRGFLELIIFEPHYPSPGLQDDIDAITNYLASKNMDLTLNVRGIGGRFTSLQHQTPNCVQWSMLMCLMFILNPAPPDYAPTAQDNMYINMFDTVAQYRHVIMPMWLFFLYQSRGDTELDPDWDHSFRRKNISRDPTTDLDPPQCRMRTEQQCTNPCEWSGLYCFNPKLNI